MKLREVEFFPESRLVVLRLFAVCSVAQSCERDVTHVGEGLPATFAAVYEQEISSGFQACRLSACLFPSWEYDKMTAFN